MKRIIISSAPQARQAPPHMDQQMTTRPHSITNEQIPFPGGRNGIQRLRPWCSKLAAVALTAAALLTAASSPAAQLIWDAGNTNNGATIDPASGSWNTDTTTNLNWNNGSGNVGWTQTSTTAGLNGATFAGVDAPAGTYQIALDGGQIAETSIIVSNNGYYFYGSPIYQNSGNYNRINNGVSVTFSNNFVGGNWAASWQLGLGGAPATLNIAGSYLNVQGNFASTNGSTVIFGNNVQSGSMTVNAPCIMTNGTLTTTTTFQIGRPGGSSFCSLAGNASFPASLTLDGPNTIDNVNGGWMISRNGGWGTVTIQNGPTLNFSGANVPSVLHEATAGGHAYCYMKSGTMNVGGNGNTSSGPIKIDTSGAGANSVGVFSQSGGTIYAWGGILIGAASGTPGTNSFSAFTNSGGFLYIGYYGSYGITLAPNRGTTTIIDLSGGTVGALQSWASAAPLTLDTLNGNITFQCADDFGSQNNITLSGALTGPGGLYKTGSGTLALSGANNYAGSTVVSNGTLAIMTSALPTNGPVTLDGSAGGTPALAVTNTAGQYWSIGTLTFAAGSPTMSVDFGTLPPSTSVAPIQVAGGVVFTAPPAVTITGTAIPTGIYPLIKYTTSVSSRYWSDLRHDSQPHWAYVSLSQTLISCAPWVMTPFIHSTSSLCQSGLDMQGRR